MRRRFFKGWASKHFRKFTRQAATIIDTGLGSAAKVSGAPPPSDKEDAPPKRGYDEIKAECLENGTLWEDPDFPAETESLFTNNPPSCWPDVEWKRPHEICEDPQMFVDGATRMDVNQGVLGDCWLLAAVASLSTNPTLLSTVVPHDQSFQDDYAGIFRVKFWQYGHWVEVLVDDRLPVKNDRLIYMHSDERNEFWSAILEKAYAKIHGCYEALSGGLTVDAMTDFTGGLCTRLDLGDNTPSNLFHVMLKAKLKGALMGCSIDSSADSRESELPSGLLIGHAYSVTDVRLINVTTESQSGQIPMVRVRNPWGDSHEWRGAWGDNSAEWSFVSEEERESLGLVYSHDGEFWMSYRDFVSNFQRLEICFLGPDTMVCCHEEDDENPVRWESCLQDGYWQRGINAGGCRNYPGTFWTNPQYVANVEDVDSEDEEGINEVEEVEEGGTIIVGIMQKNRRSTGQDNLAIGYYIFSVEGEEEDGTLDGSYFRTHGPAARSPIFSDLREVSGIHRLPPGRYVVTPCTFDPDVEAEFVLRIFSEREGDKMEVLDDPTTVEDKTEELIEKETDDDKTRIEEACSEFINRAGEDGHMNAEELQELLNEKFTVTEYQMDGFSIDMARTMIAISDDDYQGTLCYNEYSKLITDLTFMAESFKECDMDQSGFINSYELRHALRILGYRVSNATFAAMAIRYSNRERHITFDDFVTCCLKLKAIFHAFNRNEQDGDGVAQIGLNEFLNETVHC